MSSVAIPPGIPNEATARFDEWVGGREPPLLGTNAGAPALAFQTWHRFKEAFAPELIRRAVTESNIAVNRCVDPFGGSGTTALATQFLGIESTTVEVNPFLVDLIRAKVASYDVEQLIHAASIVASRARRSASDPAERFASVPPTFIEPGVAGRWLFNRDVAAKLAALLDAIETLQDAAERRLFKVLLGGILVSVSNVVVSGKGRRYRRDWKNRPFQAVDVAHLFGERVRGAISDIHRFAARPAVRVEVLHGDARRVRPKGLYDVAVLSPPYPNSFDYTDVYNVELWVLGYLNDSDENKALRNSTLASHVQLQRAYAAAPGESETLKQTLERLHGIRDNLWSPWIPQMIGGYFADLVTVLRILHDAVAESGACWLVVGDSRYGGIRVPTATVLSELACSCGWAVQAIEPFRSMRSSAQQGGRSELAESLLIFNRALPRA